MWGPQPQDDLGGRAGIGCPRRTISKILAPNGKPRPSQKGLSAVTREGLGELGLLLGKVPCKELLLAEDLQPSRVLGW